MSDRFVHHPSNKDLRTFVRVEPEQAGVQDMVNKHERNDNITARISKMVFRKNGFFRNSVEGPSFSDHINAGRVIVPRINGEGIHELQVETLTGPLEAAFEVARWRGDGYPTVIFHHGNNERPFDRSRWAKNTFRNIFLKDEEFDANLIVVRAPFHDGSLKNYLQKIGQISDFMAMISASVTISEAIIKSIREVSDKPIVVSGISLGGWVTNLHHAFFGSADLYVPMLAGARLGHVFTSSAYSVLTSPRGLRDKDHIEALLDFQAIYRNADASKSMPLLALYDKFIVHDVQAESYKGVGIKVIERGHVTATLDDTALRDHIRDSFQNLS